MSVFANADGGAVIREIAAAVAAQKAYLSELDGKIGDGDHGNNMAKGFGRAVDRLGPDATLHDGLAMLSQVIMAEIGGSMGPLYGMMFSDMADAIAGRAEIDAATFAAMLEAGRDGVVAIGAAAVGDKTLLDALVPAVAAFRAAEDDFPRALSEMATAAQAGRDATTEMVAKAGRASRLGERSRGHPDAGATSCCIVLTGLADGVGRRLS